MAERSVKVSAPHALIVRSDVEKALKCEKGSDATLVSYEIKDFTNKGDNYACEVSSVIVKYTKGGKNLETSYVTKLNPCRAENLEDLSKIVFEKESGFYSQVLPLLDEQMEKANETRLRLPRHFHSVLVEKEQVIYLEDLRRSGFKMHDRQKGMDFAHAVLIVQELARMHASSVLLTSRSEYAGVDLVKKFPVLRDAFAEMKIPTGENETKGMDSMIQMSMMNVALLCDMIPGYEYVAEFLREESEGVGDTLKAQLAAREPFIMVGHGDTWNNNFLFRYSNKGVPLECRLLDLQVCRVTSPAIDLNHFLYSSVDGVVRDQYLQLLLTSYYATFSSLLAGTGVPMKFTLLQFQKEFYSKAFIGFFMGIILVPAVILDAADTPKLEDFFGVSDGLNQQEKIALFQRKVNENMLKSASLRPRLLSLFDEMKEIGLFKKASVSRLIQMFGGGGL